MKINKKIILAAWNVFGSFVVFFFPFCLKIEKSISKPLKNMRKINPNVDKT